MSTEVDERIVEMRFDNEDFESNIKTSTESLETFKKNLNFDGAEKGLKQVDAAANSIKLEGLGSAVENVKLKFSAMQIAAVESMRRIVDSAIDTGVRVVKALTIEPVFTGFQEYETQINAIQTILSNTRDKGTTLTEVNAALDELNHYADNTIYNFTQMTKYIGTFTVAGLGLEESVNAIKGIANLSALTGANAEQASRSMYMLSQAMSSGRVTLREWRSLVTNGIGGKIFQDSLKETARLHGIAVDEMIEKNGSFRDSLKEGWLTSQVLSETLAKFTGDLSEAQLKSIGYTEEQVKEILSLGEAANNAATKVKTFSRLMTVLKEAAQSGWTESWRTIIGDYEEAQDVLTRISGIMTGIIGKSAEARNNLLFGGLATGWKKLLDAGINDAELMESAITEVGRAAGSELDNMLTYYQGDFQKALPAAFRQGILSADDLKLAITNVRNTLNGMTVEEMTAAGYTEDMIEKFNDFSFAVNTGKYDLEGLVEAIEKPSGRENLFESLFNVGKAIQSIIKPIKDAFFEIFSPLTSGQIYSFTELLRSFTERLTLSDKAADGLKRTAKGVFAILDVGRQFIVAIFNAIKTLFGGTNDLAGGFLSLTGNVGDWLVGIAESIKQSDVFNKVLQTVAKFLRSVFDILKAIVTSNFFKTLIKIGKSAFEVLSSVIKTVWDVLSDFLDSFGGAFSTISGNLDGFEGKMHNFGDILSAVFSGIANWIRNIKESRFFQWLVEVWGAVKNVFKKIGEVIAKLFEGATFNDILNGIHTIMDTGLVVFLMDLVKRLSHFLDKAPSIFDKICNLMDQLKGALKSLTMELKSEAVLRIAIAIAVLAVSLAVLSAIKPEKLETAIQAITTLFIELGTFFVVMSKTASSQQGATRQLLQMSRTMVRMSAAILIMAIAVKQIAGFEPEQIFSAIGGIVILLAAMAAFIKVMKKDDNKKLNKVANSMIIFAIAINVMARAVKKLASLSWEELARGLVGVVTLLTAIAIAVKLMPSDSKLVSAGAGILLIAFAIKVLSKVAIAFSSLSWESLGKGLAGVIALLAALVAAVNLMPKGGKLLAAGIGMLGIAAGLAILGQVAKVFAKMSWEEMARGLSGIAILLAEVVIATQLMPKNLPILAIGLLLVSEALVVMGLAMKIIGSMSDDKLNKAMLGLAVGLATIALALNAMKGTLGGAAALVVVAAALAILVPLLVIVGMMKWESIIKGLAALAGAFAIFAIAGYALEPVIGVLYKFSGALVVMGVGMVLVGAGVALFGLGLLECVAALLLLAAVGPAAAVAIAGAIVIILKAIISLIPYVAVAIANAIIAFCEAIEAGAPAIASAIKTVLLLVIDILIEIVPKLVEGIFVVIVSALESLVKYTPTIVQKVFEFLVAVTEGLATYIPDLIQAFVDLLMAILKGVIDAFKTIDPEVLTEGLKDIGILIAITGALGLVAALIPAAMIGVIGMGVVIAELAFVLAAIGKLAEIPGLTEFIANGAPLLEAIGFAIGSLVGGLVAGISVAVAEHLIQIGIGLSQFMMAIQPFVMLAGRLNPAALAGVAVLVAIIVAITAAELLSSITRFLSFGKDPVQNFAKQVTTLGEGLKGFSESAAGIDEGSVSVGALALKHLAEAFSALPSSGGIFGLFTGNKDAGSFTEALPAFGTAITDFSNNVKDVVPARVNKGAQAGIVIANMAKELPNSGGVAGFFAGNNDMEQFKESIPAFGEAITKFSDAVAGINSTYVEKGTKAGTLIANMAKELPNSGGVAGFFAGNNDMEQFKDSIPAFGEALKGFSDACVGLTPANVENGVKASEVIAKLITDMPDISESWLADDATKALANFKVNLFQFGQGLISFASNTEGYSFTGVEEASKAGSSLADMLNSLAGAPTITADFTNLSEQLGPFGEGLSKFSLGSYYVDPDHVSAVAECFDGIVKILNSIAGIGDSTLITENGEALASFGVSLSDFSNSISDIDAASVQAVCAAFGELVSLLQDASLVATDTASSLTNNMMALGNVSVRSMADAFNGSYDTVSGAVSTCLSYATTTITNEKDTFANTFSDFVSYAVDGISSSGVLISFTNAGKAYADAVGSGVTSKQETTKTTIRSFASTLATTFKNKRSDFYDSAVYFIDGFINGINNHKYRAVNAVKYMAQNVINQFNKTMDERSPSRITEQSGIYFVQGFINGLNNMAKDCYTATSDLGNSAVRGMNEAIANMSNELDAQLDTQPVIRPVLDLSNVQSRSHMLSALLSRDQAMLIGTNVNNEKALEIQNGLKVPEPGDNYSFVQNNYSPKALSRIEIYRQTKNQFSAMKGLATES